MKEKKSYAGKIVAVFIMIMLLFSLAIGSEYVAKKMMEDVSAEDVNLYGFASTPYTMYYAAKREAGNQNLTPEEVFFTEKLRNNIELRQKYGKDDTESFSYYINQWTNNMFWAKSIFGAIYDTKTQKELYRIQNENSHLVSESNLFKISDKVKEDALCAVLLSYDETGKMTVIDSFGMEKWEAQRQFEDNSPQSNYGNFPIYVEASQDGNYNIDESKETFLYPKNVTILTGISKTAVTNSYNQYDPYYNSEHQMYYGFLCLLAGILAVLMITAIILVAVRPFRINDTFLAKIPLEAVVIAAVAVILLTKPIIFLCFAGASHTILNELIYEGNLPKKLANVMERGALYGGLVLYYGTILCGMIAALQIFVKGIKRFCIENILTVKVICYLKQKIGKLFHSVFSLDYKEPVTKQVVKMVVLNAVVLTLLCCIWFLGILGVIVYSVVLFYFLRKYIEKLKKQYNQVYLMASKMAEGNLEVSMHEECGVLEPIAQKLQLVQSGFKKAVAEEVKSTRMRTDLISNVSHDLKTPLTAIITYVNLLKEENLTKEQTREYIETLDSKSMRLKQLIDDLFEVSKMSSNNVTLDFMEVDIVELIKQVQVEMSDRFEEAGISFRLLAPEEKILLTLDSQKTYRVFENLFINIVKYALPQTRAYVDVKKEKDKVIVSVKNISAVEMNVAPEELTERFVRGDASRTTEGSGLGLAIAKSIVEIEHGTMQVVMDGDLFKVMIEFRLLKQAKEE